MARAQAEKAEIKYEKDVTIQDVLDEAEAIWIELKRRKLRPTDHEQLDAFYKETISKHKELMQAYPIVLRYLCQMCLYDGIVFRRFIDKMTKNPCKSESDYLDLQADYVLMLYKKFAKHWDKKTGQEVWAKARKELQAETDHFKEVAKKWHEDQKQKQEMRDDNNKKDFAQFFEENKDFFANDGNIPLVVKSDVVANDAAETLANRMRELKQDDDDLSLYLS